MGSESAKLPFLRDDFLLLEALVAIQTGRRQTAMTSIGAASGANGTESWHDNPAFDIAQQDSARWIGQEAELRWYLDSAVLVEPPTTATSVEVGHMVRIRYMGTNDEEWVYLASYKRIVGNDADEDENGVTVMSAGSAVGRAILGAKPGDTVTAEVRKSAPKRWATEVAPRPGKVERTFKVTVLQITIP